MSNAINTNGNSVNTALFNDSKLLGTQSVDNNSGSLMNISYDDIVNQAKYCHVDLNDAEILLQMSVFSEETQQNYDNYMDSLNGDIDCNEYGNDLFSSDSYNDDCDLNAVHDNVSIFTNF